MTHTELWLTYQLASRAHLKDSATTQLLELEFQNHKLVDLEDVLDHVFRQGFVEAKHRSATWWESKAGTKIRAGATVEEVLHEGVGKCPDTSLRLVVQDIPPALWFTYVYKHSPHTKVVTQRIKLPLVAPPSPGACPIVHKTERLAHVTNYIFSQGYLVPKYRSVVHWEGLSGKKIEEYTPIEEALSWGVGIAEDKPLQLIIDAAHPEAKPTCPGRDEVIVIHPPHYEHYPHHHHHHVHSPIHSPIHSPVHSPIHSPIHSHIEECDGYHHGHEHSHVGCRHC